MHNFALENNMKILKAISEASNNAVKAASCLGVKFFSLNMKREPPSKRQYEGIQLFLIIEFVAYPFYSGDTFDT